MTDKNKIILTTLNARYSHASIALRYLYANLEEMKGMAEIQEYVINEDLREIAEKMLQSQPSIIGIGVYIWNAADVQRLIAIIKKVSPEVVVVLGGPEVSHLPLRVNFSEADYIIQGEGEIEFRELCRKLLTGEHPQERIIKAAAVDIGKIHLPYEYYTDHDIQARVIYVEASRGCPFTCEFCLSSLDKTVRYFDTSVLLDEFERLWQRGARKFKFIDRTFNLNIKITNAILDFFLKKEPPYLVHFEVVPDNFPESLKERLKQFPKASLQLEAGIQTMNSEVADNISRRHDFEKIEKNLRFIETETSAHLHSDLIIGLPGETLESFGKGLNRLASMTTSEIQIGILKKLSGTGITRHDVECGMVYSDHPPYEILQNKLIPYSEMQRMRRFARFWDIVYNSGNFSHTAPALWMDGDVYGSFSQFSQWVYEETKATHQISIERMALLLFNYLTEKLNQEKSEAAALIAEDLLKIRGRKLPDEVKQHLEALPEIQTRELSSINKRQLRHL